LRAKKSGDDSKGVAKQHLVAVPGGVNYGGMAGPNHEPERNSDECIKRSQRE
jgi:hypothetical protein